ncbi:small hydrophobic protein [Swine pneumovirus 57]|nr:small hydrophobic protein [Swine pneumovirus 57]QXO83599.1 small hydrophobic protein [Canine pneumovirus]WPS68792.1 small hydrophobic protein [Swine orthopneumovirus]
MDPNMTSYQITFEINMTSSRIGTYITLALTALLFACAVINTVCVLIMACSSRSIAASGIINSQCTAHPNHPPPSYGVNATGLPGNLYSRNTA